MNFFEGRIYKPQGKDLTQPVISRVPVTIGSLSICNGLLYYCKSCTYVQETHMYTLIWDEVVVENEPIVTYNNANGSSHINISNSTIEDADDTEQINSQKISLSNNDIVPSYPTVNGLLFNTIDGQNINNASALLYGAMSYLEIDGSTVTSHFYANPRIWYDSDYIDIGYMYKSMFHTIKPHEVKTTTRGREMKAVYHPPFGATQYMTYMINDSATKYHIDVVAMSASNQNIQSLLGSHIVLTYRTFYFAGVVSSITYDEDDDVYNIEFEDVNTNDDTNEENIQLTSCSEIYNISSSDADYYKIYNDSYNECDYVDESDISPYGSFWGIHMRFNFEVPDDSKDISGGRCIVYVKLNQSFVSK